MGMGVYNAVAWTLEMDSLLGTISDEKAAVRLGVNVSSIRHRRHKLGRQSYRSTVAAQPVICANCGRSTPPRLQRDRQRARQLFCNRECASAAQKLRDSETLRYGAGWKRRRAEIRRRDAVCRSCGKTPKQNGSALHVHHLVPFRYGGTNQPENLVALCESCHHVIEIATSKTLASIQVAVNLDGPFLTIAVENETRWTGFVHGTDRLAATA